MKQLENLYVGIGYFTLPFLLHGHVHHLYACEWNQDSIEALHRNHQANHIDNDHYTLLLEHNQFVYFVKLFLIISCRHVLLV